MPLEPTSRWRLSDNAASRCVIIQDPRPVRPSNARYLILPLFVRPAGASAADRRDARPRPGFARPAGRKVGGSPAGIGGVILFGIPDTKDAHGSDATSRTGIIAQAVAQLKAAVPDLLVITDVCFCEYTDHGHCGALVERNGQFDVDNDATLEMLVRQAVVHARAGADIVAPSGMMDGGDSRRADAVGFSPTCRS